MIYLSCQAHHDLKKYLLQEHEITEIGFTGLASEEIQTHPDLYFCDLGLDFFFGDPSKLSPGYPEEIRYNAACTGKFFIHNLRYTDPDLLQMAVQLKMSPIHVNQGYTKCNTVVVNEKSVITEDRGMVLPMKKAGLDVLAISAGHVLLPGHPSGFLGGASGRIGNEIIFHGNLSAHPDYHRIVDFIQDRNIKVRDFKAFPLADIGSILWDKSCQPKGISF